MTRVPPRQPLAAIQVARRRARTAWPRAGWAVLLLALGCGSEDSAPATQAHPPIDVRFRLESGPVEEIRVRTRSDGAFVVSGFTYFPDGTRLVVALTDSTGFTQTQTQPTVENALFEGLPLRTPDGTPWPGGTYHVHVSARFGQGQQDEQVMQESDGGRAFDGEGMSTTRDGSPVFSKSFRIDR